MSDICGCGICAAGRAEKEQQKAETLASPTLKRPFEKRVVDLANSLYVERPRLFYEDPEYTYSDAISDAIDIIIAGDNQ